MYWFFNALESTSVGCLRRARILWNSLRHLGRLKDVARAPVSERACDLRLNVFHRTNAEISPDYRMVFPLWSGRKPAPVTTAEVNQRPAQLSPYRRVNSRRTHINNCESRKVRDVRRDSFGLWLCRVRYGIPRTTVLGSYSRSGAMVEGHQIVLSTCVDW